MTSRSSTAVKRTDMPSSQKGVTIVGQQKAGASTVPMPLPRHQRASRPSACRPDPTVTARPGPVQPRTAQSNVMAPRYAAPPRGAVPRPATRRVLPVAIGPDGRPAGGVSARGPPIGASMGP